MPVHRGRGRGSASRAFWPAHAVVARDAARLEVLKEAGRSDRRIEAPGGRRAAVPAGAAGATCRYRWDAVVGAHLAEEGGLEVLQEFLFPHLAEEGGLPEIEGRGDLGASFGEVGGDHDSQEAWLWDHGEDDAPGGRCRFRRAAVEPACDGGVAQSIHIGGRSSLRTEESVGPITSARLGLDLLREGGLHGGARAGAEMGTERT